MKSFFENKPLARFLAIALSSYLIWLFFYEGILPKLELKTPFDVSVSKFTADSADVLLSTVGFDSFRSEEGNFVIVGIVDNDSSGVHIGPQCNGVSLFALFLIYVLAFPGPWQKKLWYIPLGILSIHLLNTIRIALLAYIQRDYPEYLDLNHTYTFQIMVYGFVFFLWYIWTSRLSGININETISGDK